MQKTVVKLLVTQPVIAIVLLVLTWLSAYRYLAHPIFLGTLVSIITSAALMLVIRKLPKVLKARTFYALMWLCEILKWLIIIILMIIFLKMQVNALGLVIGFATTYVGGYFMMLILK